MSRKPRKPSKRKRPPSNYTPRVQRMIDDLTAELGAEKVRSIMATADLFGDPVFLRVLGEASNVGRAGLYVCLKIVMDDLTAGHGCDLCDQPAESFRFVTAGSEQVGGRLTNVSADQHFCGFLLLCERCLKLSPRKLAESVIGRAKKRQDSGAEDLSPKPLLFGLPIGEVGSYHMPARTSLDTCSDCGKTIWLNQDHVDTIGEKAGRPIVLCLDCTLARGENIHFVPLLGD